MIFLNVELGSVNVVKSKRLLTSIKLYFKMLTGQTKQVWFLKPSTSKQFSDQTSSILKMNRIGTLCLLFGLLVSNNSKIKLDYLTFTTYIKTIYMPNLSSILLTGHPLSSRNCFMHKYWRSLDRFWTRWTRWLLQKMQWSYAS